jgi:beta-N-acetylhexosaminidase
MSAQAPWRRTTTWAGAVPGAARGKAYPVRVSPFWLRIGGVAVAGAAVIACTTTAAVGGTSATQPRRGHAGAKGADPAGAVDRAASAAASARAAAAARAAANPEASVLAKLSPEQLAGQRVIYSYSGLTPPASLLSLIRHGDVAGVIFFGQNISSKSQVAAAIRQLEAADAAKTNPVRSPLLLMTDQEGGEVRRLPGAPALSEKQIGEASRPGVAATNAGAGAAANLRSVGMNVNLAPVLDVYRHPGDFDDQFQRSYSTNPSKVSYLGADFITAQQKGGVAATAKHFPGLGSATRTEDTDVRPVTLHASKTTLRNIDEYPYKAAIAAGVKLVMVSWAVYTALDPTRPAGLSSTIIQGELRDRLGFKGVTITDALEAGALRAYGSIAHRSYLAAKAGMDLILCSEQNPTEGNEAVANLEYDYNSRALNRATFKADVAQILTLRASLPK